MINKSSGKDKFQALIDEIRELDAEAQKINQRPTWLIHDKGNNGVGFNFGAQHVINAIYKAYRNGAFEALPELNAEAKAIRTPWGLQDFLSYLEKQTGIKLLVEPDAIEPVLPRLIAALKCLNKYGVADSNPKIAKYRTIAIEAEKLWESMPPDTTHTKFLELVAHKSEISLRTVHRRFREMERIPDYSCRPWIRPVKSADTGSKDKRKTIARHFFCDKKS
jgi:hypothetical protein